MKCRLIVDVAIIVLMSYAATGCMTQQRSDSARSKPSASTAKASAPESPRKSGLQQDQRTSREATQPSKPPAAVDGTTPVKQSGATAEQTAKPAGEPTIATPFPGVRVWVNAQRAEFDGIVCIDAGWLEFIACSPQTKEHESLVVFEQRPSNLHAALLLAGFEAGHPGRWTYENEQYELIPPEGSKLQIEVRYSTTDGEQHTHSVCRWVQDHLGRHEFPCKPWVFGGSQFAANPPSMGSGEHYVADMTGSVIGLATFGDEMIGYSTVISHDSSVQAPEWQAYTERLPPIGTAVTVIITPFE